MAGSLSGCVAPRATDVAVAGEWTRADGAPNAPQKLTRNADGLWSLTVGPLEPNIYIYVFQVDGVTMVDPVNPILKLRARTSASMVEVPGAQPWEFRDVPHGNLQVHTHAAPTLGGAQRDIVVYTPPGYEAGPGRRYPVLYLLHGNNDLAVGWTMAGQGEPDPRQPDRRGEDGPHDGGHALGPRPALRHAAPRRPADEQRRVRAIPDEGRRAAGGGALPDQPRPA